MVTTTVSARDAVRVVDYRCSRGPADEPFVERHGGFSLSYVRSGSFGYRVRGASFELVAGSVMVGRATSTSARTTTLTATSACPSTWPLS